MVHFSHLKCTNYSVLTLTLRIELYTVATLEVVFLGLDELPGRDELGSTGRMLTPRGGVSRTRERLHHQTGVYIVSFIRVQFFQLISFN